MKQWRPIESAPKDGRKILLFGLRDGKPVYEVDYWHEAKDNNGFTGWGSFNPGYWPPTHWMPLPDPPDAEVG